MSGHSALVLDELDVKLELMLRTTALKVSTDEIHKASSESNASDIVAQNRSNPEGRGRRRREGRPNFDTTRTSFGVDVSNVRSPDRRHAQLGISMKFKSTNPPELLSRIIDKLNNATDVYAVIENEQS
jgi:hypothetical protein